MAKLVGRLSTQKSRCDSTLKATTQHLEAIESNGLPTLIRISRLGADAIVKVANPHPQLVQKPTGAQNTRTGFYGFLIFVFVTVHRPQTLDASRYQEEATKSRTDRFFLQVLRYVTVVAFPVGAAHESRCHPSQYQTRRAC